MSKENENHVLDDKTKNHSTVQGRTEGGKCLSRHVDYVAKQSCSHRWQAKERAGNEDAARYNSPVKAWAVTEKNFRSELDPYPHESHHIIPDAELNNGIASCAKKSSRLGLLIRRALLKAKYNLNHKENMMILPTVKWVGRRLRLPVHLHPNRCSHDVYSAMVGGLVTPAFDQFAALVDQPGRKHPKEPAKLTAARLNRVSKILRETIFTWGEESPGAVLDDLAKNVDFR